MVYLSKSKYCGLWQCPKIAWLRKYKPETSRLDGSVLARMEAGNEVGALARSLYGDFVDITAYTKLPYIYRLNLDYTPERGQRLWEYLKTNCQSGTRCELWNIDMGARDLETIQEELLHLDRTYVTVEALSPEIIEAACNHVQLEAADFPRMLIIQ